MSDNAASSYRVAIQQCNKFISIYVPVFHPSLSAHYRWSAAPPPGNYGVPYRAASLGFMCGKTSEMIMETKISVQPIYSLSVSSSCRKMAPLMTPNTLSSERKSEANAEGTYLRPTFCRTKPTSVAASPKNSRDHITFGEQRVAAEIAPSKKGATAKA